MNLRTLLAVTALVGATAVPLADAAAPKITSKGVGRVLLGRTSHGLRSEHLIGRVKSAGCDAAGPTLRAARLRAPLKGFVQFIRPRLRATQITITGGAKARGVGVGSTVRAVRRAFPKAKVKRILGFKVVDVPRGGGGPLQFLIEGKVSQIGIPGIAFCE
ncbi:MAG TPA: hypothetical protein VH418_04420 [Solirubrobacteraceae bacterium]